MIHRLIIFIFMLTMVSMKTSIAQQPPKFEAIPIDPELRIGKLSNGMTYYIKRNQKPEKQAEFYIFSNVGAIQEEDSQIGLAHFLEHMAFNGTKNLPGKGVINYLEKIGVKLGVNLNASTGVEQTLYTMSGVPLHRSGIIDTALLILHDWSGYISLNHDQIDKERKIILEELRQRRNAGMRIYEKAMPLIYNNSKYAYRNIIGTEENLKSFPYQELEDFYHRWYIPQRQAIFVVGDVDVDLIEKKIRTILSDIPTVENPEQKIIPQIPDNDAPLVGIITDPESKVSEISIYIRRPPMMRQFNDKVITARLNMSISLLVRLTNNRLAELAHQENAPFIRAGISNGALTAGCDAISGQAIVSSGNIGNALESFYSALEKIRRYGFTESEFERAKSEMLSNAQSKFDHRNDRTNREFITTYINHYKNNLPAPSAEAKFTSDTSLLNSINVIAVNKNAKWIISDKNQVIIVSAPQSIDTPLPTEENIQNIIAKIRNSELESYVDNTTQEPLITEKLEGSPVQEISDSQFGATKWILANGIKILLKPTDFKSDEILFSAIAPGGLSLCTDAEYTSGKLVIPLIGISGLGKFSAIDMAKKLAGKDMKVTPFINEYNNGLSGYTSPRDIETLLQLVYLYFNAPRFEQSDYNILIERYSTAIANKAGNPKSIFQDSVVNTIYSRNKRRQILTVDMIRQMNFMDMQHIYHQLFSNARNFTFTFVGNINPDTFKPLIEKYIGSLVVSQSRQTWKNDGTSIVKGEITNRFSLPMNTPKTTVYYQYTGDIEHIPENMFNMAILNQILRLRYASSIREEKGGAYSISSKGILIDIPEPKYSLTVSFHTAPDKADELAAIIPEEIKKIATEGPLPEDLANIREFLLKQRPEELRDNNTWMMYINKYNDKGIDLYKHYDEWINHLDSQKIQSLAAKILKDHNLIRVIQEPSEILGNQ